MTALQSIKKKLSPLGIYNLETGTNITAELSAYAYALDNHRNNMDTALRECFISTCEDYGLEIREKILGRLRADCSISQRRDMLRLRRGFGDSDFTLRGFDKFMKSLGVESYSLLETPSTYSVAVTISNTFSPADAKWIENQIKLILPAHLSVVVYYGGALFSEIDAEDRTYNAFDAQDKTWAQIDNIH